MTSSPEALTPGHTTALLLASMETLRAEAEALGPEAVRWHPAEGEWCVNEVVGHVLEAEERGFAGRNRRIVEQPGRVLVTWDQPVIARERRDCEKDGMELMAELERVRGENIKLVGNLTAEQLQLSGEHPQVGELRIIDLLHEWPHHDREHVKQVLSITQACVWANMGNSRRFAEVD